MTDYKPRLFIGSSKEGQPIAEQVEKELSSIADCKIWCKQFEMGNSAYEDLVNKLSLYDYGVLIATSDDITYSRKTEKTSPRDNVIFEFGLFAGRLGRQRAFLMAESGVKIPSDLNGITLPFFPSAKAKGLFSSRSVFYNA
jgi:predicted nucleotide-binding protein